MSVPKTHTAAASWVKRGLIFSPTDGLAWSRSHAQTPVVDQRADGTWRIYYATRCGAGKSRISYVDVEAGRPEHVLYVHDRPVLDLGRPGTFDDSGVMPTCVIDREDVKLLYYIGWMERVSVPYQNAIGLAVSTDGGDSFERAYEGPVIGVGRHEPFFTGTCFVLEEATGYRAYYLSCVGWERVAERQEPRYDIKIATSSDGFDWQVAQGMALRLVDDEGGLASASVIKVGEKYTMWYSVRGRTDYRTDPAQTYRIGCAESADGIMWTRSARPASLEAAPMGWDSQMTAYPYVVRHQGVLYMFYNGNGFGRSGFGYATLPESEL